MFSSLLASLAFSHAGGVSPPQSSGQVASFTIHVIHAPNDPQSVAAKETLKDSFCKTFEVTPCEPNPSGIESSLHLMDDLVVNAPADSVQEVLAFFQQRRIARLNAPATVDLDLVFYPNTGSDNDFDFGIWAGARHPVDMNKIYRAGGGSAAVRSQHKMAPPSIRTDDEDTWAYTCSSDADGEGKWVDLCSTGPFAPTTTCRASPLGLHLHMYNWGTNSDDTSAKAKMQELASAALGIPDEICHDNYGHEEPHNASCWLGGPTFPPTLREGPPGGGSFVPGHYSIYIINDDFARIASWVLQNNVPEVMGKKIDYLLHPCYGCNFADHQEWSLFSGSTPNNLFGIANSGDWQESTPPRIDPLGPLAANKCGCSDPSPTAYNLHLLYDPTDDTAVSAKDQLVTKLRDAVSGAQVVDDSPFSFTDATSPFLGGQVHFKIQVADVAAAMNWLSSERGSIDVILAPETCCGSLADYTENSIWAGRQWPMNKAALSSLAQRSVARQFLQMPERSVPLASTHDFLLYVNYAAVNKWQSAAADAFLAKFASEFDLTRQECATWQPAPEPQFDQLCMMNEVASPTRSSAMVTGYGAVYVPKDDVARVLAWSMTHRGAEVLGYQVDLLFVPLTGNAAVDYSERAFHAGTVWAVNGPALVSLV